MKSSIYTPLQTVAWLVLDDGQRAMRSVVVLVFVWFFTIENRIRAEASVTVWLSQ